METVLVRQQGAPPCVQLRFPPSPASAASPTPLACYCQALKLGSQTPERPPRLRSFPKQLAADFDRPVARAPPSKMKLPRRRCACERSRKRRLR